MVQRAFVPMTIDEHVRRTSYKKSFCGMKGSGCGQGDAGRQFQMGFKNRRERRKMHMKKRFVALLMVMLMLALTTGTALAAETTTITIRVIKKIVGIDPADLPDGTTFKLGFFDMDDNSLDGKPSWRAEFSKGDLMNAVNGSIKDIELPVKTPGGNGRPVHIGVVEDGAGNLPGYRLDVNMDCSTGVTPGEKPDDPDDGSIPVGSFEFIINPNSGPVINSLSRAGGPICEITITNILTPIEMNLPQTGDESNLALWSCAMLLSSAAGMMLLRKKREA